MRTQWFGDRRDVVKWALLVRLAEDNTAARIIQVACRWAKEEDKGESWDGYEKQIATFFQKRRKLESIEELQKFLSLKQEIEMLDPPVASKDDPQREYFMQVFQELKKRTYRKVVLLDPDTGLQPGKRSTERHITLENVKTTYESLGSGDFLVIYQHKPLFEKKEEDWKEARRKKLATIKEIKNEIQIGENLDIAKDVVFFYVQKAE